MKKRLFYQNIIVLALSLLLTALIVYCCSGLFTALKELPVQNYKLSSESIVIKNNEVLYTSLELSEVEQQNLLLTAKSNSGTFLYKNISYRLSQKKTADGGMILSMTPNINQNRLYLILSVFSLLVLIAVYLCVIFLLSRKNEREITAPLNSLRRSAHALAGGKLDVNIPDDGYGEIEQLGKEIEALRLRLKEEVYYNQKAIENRKFLISSMSHDLRTPITSLKGYLEGIMDGVADTDEKRKLYIAKSLQKTELIYQMITDLLLYSKLDLNQVEFKLQSVNITDYLKGFTEDCKQLFAQEKKQILFSSSLTKDYAVNIDMQQFDRVMGNVITNALKYIPPKTGTVEVLLKETGASVLIEIKDNGSGISAEDLPKIFDRFYRCEKSRQIKGSSGLGLAISKQIVENLGGRIWAVSKENQGTSLMISLKKGYPSK